MGMYNEVFKRCPSCCAINMVQISQVVGGFGNFDLDLDSNSNIKDLTQEEKHHFAGLVNKETFYCDRCGEEHKAQVIVSASGDPSNMRVYI